MHRKPRVRIVHKIHKQDEIAIFGIVEELHLGTFVWFKHNIKSCVLAREGPQVWPWAGMWGCSLIVVMIRTQPSYSEEVTCSWYWGQSENSTREEIFKQCKFRNPEYHSWKGLKRPSCSTFLGSCEALYWPCSCVVLFRGLWREQSLPMTWPWLSCFTSPIHSFFVYQIGVRTGSYLMRLSWGLR